MKRLLREPLLHFLALSGLLFVVYAALPARESDAPLEIVVTRGRIESIVSLFARTWQRPPSAEELQGLIDDYVREEVLYREGIALGLDRDDAVIRRRVRQKVEFVSEELTAPAEPTEDELQAYLDAHPASFAIEPRFTFRQIYFDPARHGNEVQDEISRLLRDLQRDGGLNDDALGDSTMLPARLDDASARDVQATFGADFLAALARLPAGEWSGPVSSAYGDHLVLLVRRTEPGVPPLAGVREAVLREWTLARQREAEGALYRRLRGRYTVTVERPGSGQASATEGDDR